MSVPAIDEFTTTAPAGPRPAGSVSRIAPANRGWRSSASTLARQLVLVGVAALVYFGVRGLTEGSLTSAVAHAHEVLGLERRLGFDVEGTFQAAILDHHWLVTAANWVYIWGHWPVIAGTLVWLHRRGDGEYRLLRNAMFVSGAIGLVVFVLYPVAPPRLAGMGLVDTVTVRSNSYRVLQPPALVNKYAAVPSLHVGWNFLVGVMLWRESGRRWWRWAALLSPALMLSAVVLTGNHFVFDGLIGITIAGVGLLVAERLGAARLERGFRSERMHVRQAAVPAALRNRADAARRTQRSNSSARQQTWEHGSTPGCSGDRAVDDKIDGEVEPLVGIARDQLCGVGHEKREPLWR